MLLLIGGDIQPEDCRGDGETELHGNRRQQGVGYSEVILILCSNTPFHPPSLPSLPPSPPSLPPLPPSPPSLPPSVLQQLRALVSMNESLKRQETQFKAHCKEEKARLEAGVSRLQTAVGEGDSEEQVDTKQSEIPVCFLRSL